MDHNKDYEIRQILIAELCGLRENYYRDSELYKEASKVLRDVKQNNAGIGDILCKYKEFWMESRISVLDLMTLN